MELVLHGMSILGWSGPPQRMREDARFGQLRRHVHPAEGRARRETRERRRRTTGRMSARTS